MTNAKKDSPKVVEATRKSQRQKHFFGFRLKNNMTKVVQGVKKPNSMKMKAKNSLRKSSLSRRNRLLMSGLLPNSPKHQKARKIFQGPRLIEL